MKIRNKGLVSLGIAVAMVILTWLHFSLADQASNNHTLNQPFIIVFFSSSIVALGICGWTLALILLLTIFSFLRRDHLFTKTALTICGILVLSIPPLKIFKPFPPKRPFIEVLHSKVSTNEHLDKFIVWSRETLTQWNGDIKDQALAEPGRLPMEANLIYTWSGLSSNSVSLCLDTVTGEKVVGVWFSSPLPCGIAIGQTNFVLSPTSVLDMRKVKAGVYVFQSPVRN